MIGIIRLRGKYRFISNSQQLAELLRAIQKKVVRDEILLVDSSLVSSPGSKTAQLITYLCMQARHLAVSILLVGEEETKLDRRIEYILTDKLALQTTSLLGNR